MYGIELLVKEHENIIEFTKMIRRECTAILEGKEVDVTFFREAIEFGRNYADKQHHGKEEKILFRIMLEELGTLAEKLIRQGMLVEHDLGRYHVRELESALNRYEETPSTDDKLEIITNAMGYVSLLTRHIEKEDSVVYTFAERSLSDELKEKVNQETREFEEEAAESGVPAKYLAWLDTKLQKAR